MTILATPLRKHLTDIHEWEKLGDANIFPPENRLELIEGEILEMSPIGYNHSGHVARLINFFVPLVKGQAIVNAQNPIQLSNFSEPEPDFVLLRPDVDFYTARHPQVEDVLLLIEVADSSLSFDQNEKMYLYATHNIGEYWLINLNDKCVEVYRQPYNGLYQEKTTLRTGDSITLSLLNNVSVKISDIL